MVIPFETGKRETEKSLLHFGKGQKLYNVPCEYVLACIKKANSIIEGQEVS